MYDAHVVAMNTTVMGRDHCPRCNALGRVVAVKARKTSDAMSLVFKCPKCQWKNVLGFTTEFALMAQKRRDKLTELLAEVETPEERLRILGEMQALEERVKQRELM